jgi:hypothetical protein
MFFVFFLSSTNIKTMLYIKLNYISMMANNVHMQMSPAKENYSRRYIGKTLKALKGQFF